jgi:hypothetical protein
MDGTDIKEVVKVWTSRTARKQRRQLSRTRTSAKPAPKTWNSCTFPCPTVQST